MTTVTTVTLKNGAAHYAPLIGVTMYALRKLLDTDPIAFYELVMIARDPTHEAFGECGATLTTLGLLPMHGAIKDIVLSAVTGDGLDMTLTDPRVPA